MLQCPSCRLWLCVDFRLALWAATLTLLLNSLERELPPWEWLDLVLESEQCSVALSLDMPGKSSNASSVALPLFFYLHEGDIEAEVISVEIPPIQFLKRFSQHFKGCSCLNALQSLSFGIRSFMENLQVNVVVCSLKWLGSCTVTALYLHFVSLFAGTPLWSSSCSHTPSWALLCLKLWVFSVWWLHSSFCLPCKLVGAAVEGRVTMLTRTSSLRCLLNGATISAYLPIRFYWCFSDV